MGPIGVKCASLAERFVRQTETTPESVALVWADREITYRELRELARGAQQRVDRLDLAPDRPVGLVLTKTPESIALILALLGAGRSFLLPSATLPEATLTTLFAAADCAAVLSTGPDRPGLVDHAITVERGTGELRTAADPASVCFMLTTSGSTGVPKIVPLTGGAVAAFADWASAAFGIGPGRSVLNYAPLNFDLCLLDIWTTLSAGGRVVLVDPARATLASYLTEVLDTHHVDVVQAVPMFYQLLADQDRAYPADTVILTGDALPVRALPRLREQFPAARLYNVYGCTETNDSFVHEVTGDTLAAVPIGKPIDGVGAVIIDADGAEVVGEGVGELYVSTPFASRGYLDPDQAALAFGPHPTGADDRRWFRSRDIVRRDADGTLTLTGRKDFHVKVRGVQVNTQEVERALLAHPGVSDAVVLAGGDPLGGTVLHAVVRRQSPGGPHSLAVRLHCAGLLPTAAVPGVIHLVDEPLPVTSTGKPDRTRIKRTYLEARA
ncbi:AMP-binding protein [Actinokineospora sp. HUAS TT18]|uniref:AMP-binding protein n=1 Tax=Actinokineospora sp. HUAS TT18 TaxID=3447451 RepID=UPI003F525FBA